MLRRTTPMILIAAALAVPAAVDAKPVSVQASGVTQAGALTVTATNPNRYAMRGSANVIAGQQIIASKSVKLGRRQAKKLTFALELGAIEALSTSGGRATIQLKLRKAGAKKATTTRKSVTLTLPTPQAPAPANIPTSTPTPAPAPQGPQRYVGRMGTEGAYDDFELTRDGGTFTLTKPALLPASCAENGDNYEIAVSAELFDAPGPFTIGTDAEVPKPNSVAVNRLVHGGARTITYTVRGTSADATRIAGTFGMSFSESKLDILNGYDLYFVNCAGTQSWEAIPAP